MSRTDLQFDSAGVSCAAWLYRPEEAPSSDGGSAGPRPMVVMAHGFSAVREQRLDAYAERFCAAGFGVLLFDYRHFGSSGGEPRQLLDVPRQLEDWRAAIAVARGLDWVDVDRIAVFGSSFSGGHAIQLAAADPWIAAVVSQCPYTDPFASLPKLGLKTILRASVEGLIDEFRGLTGRSPRYIPVTADPGRFAMFTTPDAQPGFAAIDPPGSTWENRVAARIALRIILFQPGRRAAQVGCPVLLCACDDDQLTPAPAARRHVRKAPRHEIRDYPIGHFDIYVGEAFERAVADQTEFLVRHLAPAPQGAPDAPAPVAA